MKNPAARWRRGQKANRGDLDNHNNCASGPPAATHVADPLAEPVEIAKFWRNRRGEAVIVTLRRFEGRALVDARVSFTTREGKLQPTGKGLALVIGKLPELAKALAKAEQRARDLGLIEEGAR